MNLNVKYIYIFLMSYGSIAQGYIVENVVGERTVLIVDEKGNYSIHMDFPFNWTPEIKILMPRMEMKDLINEDFTT